MKNPLITFDLSSFLWRGLRAGKDKENGYTVMFNDREEFINSAQYGFDNCLSMMLKVLDNYHTVPVNVSVVMEGLNTKSRRQLIDPGYKAGDDKSPDWYLVFNEAKEMLRVLWLELGARVIIQDNAEGDDTCAYLAANTERDMVIATFDNDLSALNTEANAYGAAVETYIDGMAGYNKYGLFDFHLITVYKALVGDPSDKIKGCPRFGPAAFEKFLGQYGYDGLQELYELLLTGNLNDLAEQSEDPEHKLLGTIFNSRTDVIKSFELARLRPEWVNTMQTPWQVQAGKVRQLRNDDLPELRKWYGRIRLIDAENFDEAVQWAMPLISASQEVALDIETTTPDESDDWLARLGNENGVDVYGSTLCGLGLTFGRNNQYTFYISVNHKDTANVPSESVRQFIAGINRPLIIQNLSFELTVLYNEWGQAQLDNGFEGFLPDVLDTQLEASYVNENIKAGLKDSSLHYLGYQQVTFNEVTRMQGHEAELPPGGKYLREVQPAMYLTEEAATGKFRKEVEALPDGSEVEIEVPVTKQVQVLDWTGGYYDVDVLDEAGKVIHAAGDKLLSPVLVSPAVIEKYYKMHELTAAHVLSYGADDTICTIALHNHYRFIMEMEHTYKVYLDVEIDAAYQHAKNFVDGCDISIEKLQELASIDKETQKASWAILRDYLMECGWEGTRPPSYLVDLKPADIKEAYQIVFGKPLDTQMRTLSKFIPFIRAQEGDTEIFAVLLDRLLAGEPNEFNMYVQSHFTGEPNFNDGSPKQMQKLLYEVMGLPIVVRNKPTDTMRANGIFEGTPKTDALAIAYALEHCKTSPDGKRLTEILNALQLLAMVGTRFSLYYDKYPYFPHWKDGKVRSQHRQSSTNTRRASESAPNKQQLPKHGKIEGQAARFREVIVPHKPDAVIVSLDFTAQELGIIADYSKDPNMVACFVGDNLKDMHALTGVGIAQRKQPENSWSYEAFKAALGDSSHAEYKFVKECRNLGKRTNFSTEFGSMAPKLAQILLVTEDEAQSYIDAKESTFPVVGQWKAGVVDEAKSLGFVRTMLGGVRHLREALVNGDRWERSKAERQAVNFKVQGSAAEMTKKAEGRMWQQRLAYRYDAVCIGPIHDEVVWSVAISDLVEFIPALHSCMVQPYGGMTIPIKSSISFGRDFYRQIEIGDQPTVEAIKQGLKELGNQDIAQGLGISADLVKHWDLKDKLCKVVFEGKSKNLESLAEIIVEDKPPQGWSILDATEEELPSGSVRLDVTVKLSDSEILRKLNQCTLEAT